ncbi:anti-sigma factor antagonist [Lederbergia sp. NSJ-179]|uniref:anti-sigma factor antagonist n=1 Tax=Lederbergia sp. NSJ-179 TaxID=2931402 RepID=UPI001FD0BFD2|nr:anti-sigma factor antagonist [Lederbergia sp. NSJ-179]MCJ7842198.1 anti-sigma factor antagonist [Lederbergia sp. NSJ-179]
MNISIDVQEMESIISAKLAGEIDAYTAPKVREALLPLAEQSGIKIVVDLTDVHYMDSTGLGVFVGLFKTLKKYDGKLVLKGMSGRLKRLFDITGLTDVMDVNTEVEGGV